jgi:hypothetical protein
MTGMRQEAGNGRAWLPKNSIPALDAAPKPYYCGSKNPHVSAVLSRRPCLALHRRAPLVHLPPTTGKASALVRMMTWVANEMCHQKQPISLSAAFLRSGGAPVESRDHRVAVSQIGAIEATGLFLFFSQGKPHLATFIAPQ